MSECGPALGDRRPAGCCGSVESVWMVPVPLGSVGGGVVRHHLQEPVLEQVEGAVLGPAEPLAGFDHLVENGLDPRTAGDGAEDTADRALLFAHVLELRASSALSEATPAICAA